MQDHTKEEQKSAFSCNLDWTSFARKEPEQGAFDAMMFLPLVLFYLVYLDNADQHVNRNILLHENTLLGTLSDTVLYAREHAQCLAL